MNNKKVKLGDLISIRHGYAFKGEYFSSINNAVCLLTPGNFNIGGGFKNGTKFYTGPIPGEYITKAGDLIITMTDLSKDGDTLGYPAIVPKDNNIYLHNQRIGLVSISSDCIDISYLYYALTKKEYQRYIINTSSGSTVRHTSPNKIYTYELTLPPLSEQKRISNILSSFDNKIEILKKENKILENIAENIFKEWFVKYNFPNKYGKPYRDSNGKMIDSELGPIPEGWRVGKLGDFGQVICGKTPSTKNASFFGGNYPFIKIPDMTELYVFKTESTLTDLGSKELNGKIVPANSICVSCIATIGKVSITTEDSFTNQQINTIIPNQNIYREYLYFTLNNMQEYLEMIGNRGSTTFNINTEMFRNLEIVIPKEELLDSFSSATANLFEKILVNTKLTINLEIQKDKLLKELVK